VNRDRDRGRDPLWLFHRFASSCKASR
jgi:hypothetical protein